MCNDRLRGIIPHHLNGPALGEKRKGRRMRSLEPDSHFPLPAVFLVLCVVTMTFLSGCSSSPAPSPPPATTPPTLQTVVRVITPEAAARAVTTGSAGQPQTNTACSNLLMPFLPPAPPGWSRGDPVGGAAPELSFTCFADAIYRRLQGVPVTVNLSIRYYRTRCVECSILHAYEEGDPANPHAYARQPRNISGYPLWQGYLRYTTVKDPQVTWVFWSVPVENRFLVRADTTDGDREDIDPFADLVDYQGLAALQIPA